MSEVAKTVKLPLTGVTVVDLTQYIAGPICTRAMAELGADVIKVELAPEGDAMRKLPFLRNGRSAYFLQQNLGKRSICVDMRNPEGLALVKRLIEKADVLIENFSPGVMGRLGLSWEVVHALNPELILCSISAFGQEGQLADQPGFDYIAQAYTGITSMIGYPGQSPPLAGIAVGDVGAGITALSMINAALYARAVHGGGGRWLDVALIDFYFHALGMAVQLASASRGEIRPTRTGHRHQSIVPGGVFESREGHIMLMPVGEEMWRRLVRAMERPDLLDDPRFQDNPARQQHIDLVEEIVTGWLKAHPSDAAALERLQKERVPCAPVLTVEDAMRHPHLVERYTVRDVDDPALGLIQVPGPLHHLAGEPAFQARNAPDLGEHNAEVLAQHLAMSGAEVAALEEKGVLRRA